LIQDPLGSQACSFRSQHVLLKIVKWCMSKHGKSQCVRDGAGGRCPGRERRQLCKGHSRGRRCGAPTSHGLVCPERQKRGDMGRMQGHGAGRWELTAQLASIHRGAHSSTGELTADLGSSQQHWGAHSRPGELTAVLGSSQENQGALSTTPKGAVMMPLPACGHQPCCVAVGRSDASSAPGRLCAGKRAEQEGRSLIKAGTAPASP